MLRPYKDEIESLPQPSKKRPKHYSLAGFYESLIKISAKSIDKPVNGPLFISPSATFSLGN